MATSAALLTARPHRRLPRNLHPVAWWIWALGLAVAASRTTNPLLLGALIGVVTWVVVARRTDAPWAKAFRLYVIAGAVIVVIRVMFRIVFGGDEGEIVLLGLPTVPLPGPSGISLFGDITAESLLAGFYDGLRLATMLICLGGANALANPRRLLRSMPPALHEVSTAVVVALSVFPQLAESFVRVRRARRLRPEQGRPGGRGVASLVIPVLEDALDRSLLLAASMDSRGYGRSAGRSALMSRVVGTLMVAGLVGLGVGVYGLLDGTAPRILSAPMLVAGALVGVCGLWLSGTGVRRTAYRPDSWKLAELVVVASGVTTALCFLVAAHKGLPALDPSLSPLTWPQLAPLPLVGVLVGLIPAWAAPEPLLTISEAMDEVPA
ncbi:MAG TPA: energy-coupling factor transporter transmembrane component T [Nocardioidaceae bacterium]